MMRLALPSLVAAVLIALAVGRIGADRMPQAAQGGDVLSVAFADAKTTISAAMVQKADSYFHGGIDMECHDRPGGHHHHEEPAGASHNDDSQPARHLKEEGEEESAEGHSLDPWLWINRHVRAPERHVHLEGREAIEMMPWFWASVKADPHNVEAWTTAMYVADKMMKDRTLAGRILEEAKASNPESLELAWTEARFVYDGGAGDSAAAERLLENARRRGKNMCGGRLSELKPRDAETYCYILDYLSVIYAKRGDVAAIPPLVEEARATRAETPVIEWMTKRSAQGVR